ncbi:MAG: hypothetical protein EPN21_08895 [Methylococcaceae bacterium]|nr:MAG: hypothetical protein EPN21_08895 [Methylococcaceae bacterium]
MQKLKIYPPDGPKDFSPNRHNVGRSAKVPILVLNSTSLNTGRDWQFTAQTMGEAPLPGEPNPDEPPTPGLSAHQIDNKPIRLRRAEGGYADIVAKQQTFELGHAVAASACVPGLFDPMAVSGLYWDRIMQPPKESRREAESLRLLESRREAESLRLLEIRVQLVDGGVHDNQGIAGLIDNDCTCFVISDASGHMGVKNQPDPDTVPVLSRVTSILQDRVRTEGLLRLANGFGGDNIAFLSLRNGLGLRKVGWVKADGTQVPDEVIAATTLQDFGVAPEVQESLSSMRTDLDAFTEVEAYSLMLDGYRMGQAELPAFKNRTRCGHVKQAGEIGANDWQFQKIEPWMKTPTPDYLDQLRVAQSTFGKALKRLPWLWIPLILLIGSLVYFFHAEIEALLTASISIKAIMILAVIWVLSSLAPMLGEFIHAIKEWRQYAALIKYAALTKAAYRVAGLVLATLFIKGYLWFINPLYLAQGRWKKLKPPAA